MKAVLFAALLALPLAAQAAAPQTIATVHCASGSSTGLTDSVSLAVSKAEVELNSYLATINLSSSVTASAPTVTIQMVSPTYATATMCVTTVSTVRY